MHPPGVPRSERRITTLSHRTAQVPSPPSVCDVRAGSFSWWFLVGPRLGLGTEASQYAFSWHLCKTLLGHSSEVQRYKLGTRQAPRNRALSS